MTACLFGTYIRAHSANRLLHAALAGAGFDVVECHEPVWEEEGNKPAPYFAPSSLARHAVRYAAAARRLARRWRARSGPPPLVVVGFGGQLDALLARRVCRPRAGLVFAPLVTIGETLVDDRQLFPAASLRARALAALDRAALAAADIVLVDTAAHAAYLERLGIGSERTAVWHLGAEPEFFVPRAADPVARRVLFYGRYLPLHGVETIIAAAARLGPRAEFVLLGTGPGRRRAEAAAAAVRAPITWRDAVPLAALPDELVAAAVVLGVFGDGPKAAMVVPNKVYQAAAVGRPLVTRDAPALREVLTPGEHCLVCPPSDPAALATAVLRLLDDPSLAQRLGRAARAHMTPRFDADGRAAALRALLADRLGIAPDASLARRAADA